MPVQSKDLEEGPGGASPVLPRSTGSGPSPRGARGRFTSQNAAYYGRRGAAERDRRFLARFRRVEDVRREELRELRWALGVAYGVFGPWWRPRRRLPAIRQGRIEDLRRALSILQRNLDAHSNLDRIRAAEAIWHMHFHPLFFEPVPSKVKGISLPLALQVYADPDAETVPPDDRLS